MNHLLIRYHIITKRGLPPFEFFPGNIISVYWSDLINRIQVYKQDDQDDTESLIAYGFDLGAQRIDYDFFDWTRYSFCDGADLQTFVGKSTFPYMTKVSTPNHFSCVSLVCDLQISDTVTIQPASDTITPDGSIEVSATSSNGIIKYSLNPNFVYSSEGQESGIFAGLYPGTYTITAKDELGCVDQIIVEVTVPTGYGVRYRADYKDLNGIPSRVDILERGYTGVITEVIAGADPFALKSEGDGKTNKFNPIVPSTGILTLVSESNFFFRDLFTQDDRKYQMRWYKDYGNTLPGFTPAELPALSEWTNIDDGKTNWTTGAMPSVSSDSNRIRSTYDFEAGREYTFSYAFTRSSGATDWMVIISLVNSDDDFVSLTAQKYVTFLPVAGLNIAVGSWSFVAPNGAAGIAVKVVKRNSGGGSLAITSFTNTTPAEAEQPAGYELKWLGHLIANNYSEPYLNPPYLVTITATDGLADLQYFDFLDKDGSKYREDISSIKAIAEILSKTDLGINIQSVINRFETNMTQGTTDDPLAQCMFNPDTFYHNSKTSKCTDVLSEILKPFGAVIKQRNGKWFIANPEELVAEANYREFSPEGIVQTSGTIKDVVNIKCPIMSDRAVMQGGGQVLEVIPAYGKLFFEHTLLKWDSLIKSYGFEEEDIYTDSAGVKQFKNWNVNISNAPGATYGIKKTKDLEGEYNFFLKYMLLPGGTGVQVADGVSVLSAPITIEYQAVDAFEFRFKYAVLLAPGSFGRVYWTKIKWMLKVGSYYFNEVGGWTTDETQKYNDLIVDRFNDVQEKKITAAFREVTTLTEETAQVEFILCNALVYDFASIADLKDTPTDTKAIGAKMKVQSTSTLMHYYVLEEGTDAESSPDIIRPDDYTSGTNERIWVAEHLSVASRGREVSYNYLDNIVLLHFPKSEEPPEDITIQRDNNSGIKVNFEEAYLLNDIDIDNINNSERTYKNYFKLLDGTPTQEWERTYRAGKGKLLDLLSNDVVSQYKTPSNKITGSFLIDREVLPTSILNETGDGNRKYMFMGYALHDKHASIDFDIVELKDTVTDDESEDIAADFNTDFSLDFDS